MVAVMARPSPIGRRVARARQAREWTRSDLARKVDIDPSYISRLERGEISEPSPARLRQLADALGVPVHVLLDDSAPVTDDPELVERVRAALGTDKAHLVADALAAARGVPASEIDNVLALWATIAANWPGGR